MSARRTKSAPRTRQDIEADMGIRRTESSFPGARGISLFRRSWIPEAPSRLMVVVHGFAEHSGRYEDFGAWFAERGCAVHAFDLRGHGRSEGKRNHVHRFEDFLDDTGRLLALVCEEHPGLPRYVVGHSMGGLIATAFVRERAPEIDALVTSGAALAPSVPRSKVIASRVLKRIVPRLYLDAGLPAEGLSRDPEVVEKYLADPLVNTKISVGLGSEMLEAVARTAGGGAAVKVPMLLLHGAADPLCAASGSDSFFQSLSGDVRAASGLQIYPGLLHEIFNEPERLDVFADVLRFLETHGDTGLRDEEAPRVLGAVSR
jgi:alpha-beta hydrolase superfamily lysophospholipase